MSHFTVLVETTDGDYDRALARFHEYECTGRWDQYVQEIDRTKEIYTEFRNLSDRKREDYPDLPSFLSRGHGFKIAEEGADLSSDKFKFGYALFDRDGDLVMVIDRTNPDAKWDWYSLGGRWSGSMILTSGEKTDHAQKRSIDFDAMARAACEERQKTFKAALARFQGARAINGLPELDDDEVRAMWSEWSRVYCRAWAVYEDLWDNAEDRMSLPRFWDYTRRELPRFAELENEKIDELSASLFHPGVDRTCSDLDEWVGGAPALSAYAFLDRHGRWHARGEMGWFGFSKDTMSLMNWHSHIQKQIDKVAPDAHLSMIDCHT